MSGVVLVRPVASDIGRISEDKVDAAIGHGGHDVDAVAVVDWSYGPPLHLEEPDSGGEIDGLVFEIDQGANGPQTIAVLQADFCGIERIDEAVDDDKGGGDDRIFGR